VFGLCVSLQTELRFPLVGDNDKLTDGNSMLKKRKNNSPQDKVTLLERHIVENIHYFDICDQFGLHPVAGFPVLQIPAIPHKVSEFQNDMLPLALPA
jgi:hypothetical protein